MPPAPGLYRAVRCKINEISPAKDCVRPLALLEVEQNAKTGGRQRNDRIIAEPVVVRRRSDKLSQRLKQELESFFLAVTALEGKNLEILGWAGAAAADRLTDRARRSR